MSNNPTHETDSTRKFDTLRLLEGVPDTDEFKAEDIMEEFSSPHPEMTDAPAPKWRQFTVELLSSPAAPEPPIEIFFTPTTENSLGEDFWSGGSGEDDGLWDEIVSMRHPKRRTKSQAAAKSAEQKTKSAAKPAQDQASESPARTRAAKPSAADAEKAEKPSAESDAPAPRRPATLPDFGGDTPTPERVSARMRRLRLLEAEAQTPKPEVSPDRAMRHHRRQAVSARKRLTLLWALSLVALYFTLAGVNGWPAPDGAALGRLLAILSLLAMLLCYDLLVQAVFNLMHCRFRIEQLLLASTVVSFIDAMANSGSHVPYCILPTLGWTFCLWGSYDLHLAMRRTAKSLKTTPAASVRSVTGLWNQMDGIVRSSECPAGFLNDVQHTDYAAQMMQYYVPIICLSSPALALLASIKSSGSFLQVLAALLAVSAPLAGALCYTRPFALLAQRFSRSRSALCGWLGAELLGGRQSVVLQDRDVFPEGTVTTSGAKFYNDYDQNYVISCAATIFRQVGGDLSDAFGRLASEYHVDLGLITSCRAYDSGGYGAAIGQDMVLVGTVGFLRLMGIAIPDGVNLRQAVYVVINNQLAGIFSIQYSPSRSTRIGLSALCSHRRLTSLFATRDFILNPSLLRRRFRLSGGLLAFPDIDDRLHLSEPEVGADGRRAAVMGHDNFSIFSELVIGGRNLYNLTRWASLICLLSGIIGLVMVFLLFCMVQSMPVPVSTLLLYSILWAFPPLLMTSWVDKF